MKQFRRFLFLLLVLVGSINVHAQDRQEISKDTADYPYWVEMMQDPNANFNATLRAFNIYWENREITKGCGYKPFLRWAEKMKYQVKPDGSRLKQVRVQKEFYDFVAREKISLKSTKRGGVWTNVGPIKTPNNAELKYSGNGRINAIAFHPTDANKLYVGAPAGGLWVSSDNGATWSSNTDQLPSLGVSAIIVDREDPKRILIGTGDRDNVDAQGVGVMVSTDNGKTWKFANNGIEQEDGSLPTVNRMIQDSKNPKIILAATSLGIFRTENKGGSWTKVTSNKSFDIEFKPDDSNIVYALSGGTFIKSIDNGKTWETRKSTVNYPFSVIGVSRANPNVVYQLTGASSRLLGGVSKSTDAGETWTNLEVKKNLMGNSCSGLDQSGQSTYDIEIIVDPKNADRVLIGGVNIWMTEDGGQSWKIRGHWMGDCGVAGLHADQHIFEANPLNDRVYIGNDGGVYYTDNFGETFENISSGLSVSQIYKLGQSANRPEKIVCGFQDNGTSVFQDDNFHLVYGGDGMDCTVDYENDQYSYGSLYNGDAIYRIDGNGMGYNIGLGIKDRGLWVTPLVLDANDPTIMYVGMKNLWKGTNIRGSAKWTKIPFPIKSDAVIMEHSKANPQHIFVCNASNRLYRSDNLNQGGAVSWTNLSSNLPEGEKLGGITDIECNPINSTVYISTCYPSNIWMSRDNGDTWEKITANLPDITFKTIEHYKNTTDGLYLGTNAGIYYKDAGMSEWKLYVDGFPLTSNVTDLEIYYGQNNDQSKDLIHASTYGRGVWKAPTYKGEKAVDFFASTTTVNANCAIDFNATIAGVFKSVEWTFEGANTATSTLLDPTGIQYDKTGSYKVKLSVTFSDGSKQEEEKTAYVTVNDAVKPTPAFNQNKINICPNEVVEFFDLSENCPNAWKWEFTPSTVEFIDGTSATSQNPKVKFLEAGVYLLNYTATNNGGSNSLQKDKCVNVGGIKLPFQEDWENYPSKEKAWTFAQENVNDDDEKKWGLMSVNSKYNINKTKAMYFPNFSSKNMHGRYQLISPALNLNVPRAYLRFDYAYAQKYSFKDSLIVKISTDCGQTWKRIYANGPDGKMSFATRAKTSNDFMPTSRKDWCGQGEGANCVTIDLSEFQGNEMCNIMFEDYCRRGNNIYIDNIEVDVYEGTEEVNSFGEFFISPNPASDNLNVYLKESKNASIQIVDANAKVVYSGIFDGDTKQIDVSGLTPGVYLVKVIAEDKSLTEKLVIQ
ncbi:MAG: T9SS type A sorting domain-containing protein [Bacteroidales bacterium]